MANPELQLISNILRDGNIRPVKKHGLSPAQLGTEEAKEGLRWLLTEVRKPAAKNTVPSLKRFMKYFPNFDYCPSRDSVELLIEDIVRSNVREGLMGIQEEIEALIREGEDPVQVVQAVLPELRDLAVVGSGMHKTMSGSVADIKTDYEVMKTAGGMTGLAYPWQPLNRGTAGMQEEEFIVIYGRPKNMKCVAATQRIMLADGSMVPIGEAPEEIYVRSYNEETREFRWAEAQVVHSGVKPCVRVTTESGFELESGDEHYYRVPAEEGLFEGRFKRISELAVGDWVAVANAVERELMCVDSKADIRKAWVLGALVGDGCFRIEPVSFTSIEPSILDTLNTFVQEEFGCYVKEYASPNSFGLPSIERGENQLTEWLRYHDMMGKLSTDKVTPDWVFEGGVDVIRAYLAGLLDTDGTVHSSKKPYVVAWYTSSEQLSKDIKHLLRRMGIHASRKHVPSRDSWQVTVTSSPEHNRLLIELGEHLQHPEKLKRLGELAQRETCGRYKDRIPYTEALMQLILTEKGDNPWPKLGGSKFDKSKLFRRSGAISRELLRTMAVEWDSVLLMKAAQQELRWERITSIEEIGYHDCYDICIQDGGDPNFVVEGFVVHNTWVACAIAEYAYSVGGHRVLIYSKEMSDKALARRIASIIGGIDYQKLKSGRLDEDEEEELWYQLDRLEKWENQHGAAISFLSDKNLRGKRGATVDVIAAEAEKFEADLVVVDGFYLMRDGRTGVRSRDWKQISNISSDLKGMAQYLKIPVIGTTQANREARNTTGDDLAELGFADAIGQDADLVMRVFKSMNLRTGYPKIMITFPGTRDAVLDPFVIHACPGLDFSLLQKTVDVQAFLKDKKDSDEKEEGKAGMSSGRGGGQSKSGRGKSKGKNPTRI